MKRKINYYDQFKCIADKCPMTCCAGWKIAVDEDTYSAWKNLSGVCEKVVQKDDVRQMVLDSDNRCPFLQKDNLCNIVCRYGEEYLSDTCTTFPRQLNEINGCMEYSMTSGCPEVVNLINKAEKIFVMADGTYENEDDAECVDVDKYISYRDLVIKYIQKEGYGINQVLLASFYILLELRGDKDDILIKADDEKYFESLLKTVSDMDFNDVYTWAECNELFLDIVENYRKQGLYTAFIEPLAQLAEEYEKYADKKENQYEIDAFRKDFKEYDKLMRKYFAAEIFANLVKEDYIVDDLLISFEWAALEYAVIRQALFLKWKYQKFNICYEDVENTIVIVSRMTGYDDEDIYEYLKNSFEDVIWDWGYMALIAGKDNII